jgi:hypothetical protein
VKNPKNNNSILVLATLGVYLGLVLVGGTPQVLAQAAMTRQFNVREEIEFKEDLDNQPDGPCVVEAAHLASKTVKGLISSSVGKFLSTFVSAGPALIEGLSTAPALLGRTWQAFAPSPRRASSDTRLLSLLTVSRLARAGL